MCPTEIPCVHGSTIQELHIEQSPIVQTQRMIPESKETQYNYSTHAKYNIQCKCFLLILNILIKPQNNK